MIIQVFKNGNCYLSHFTVQRYIYLFGGPLNVFVFIIRRFRTLIQFEWKEHETAIEMVGKAKSEFLRGGWRWMLRGTSHVEC